MRILIADDDEITLEILDNILLTGGHKTRTAVNGREAAKIYDEFRPDLVITDIEMPEMNGLELLDAIRAKNAETIVIVATAHGSEQYALLALCGRANDYLRKPIDQDLLLGLVNKYARVVESNRRLRQVSQFITRGVVSLTFGNRLDLVGEIAEYLVCHAVRLLPEDELMAIRLGLAELITNAIEHGNLEITSEMKAAVSKAGYPAWRQRRMEEPRFTRRWVTVKASVSQEYCEWTIFDQGPGFDWHKLPQEFETASMLSSTCRGVLLCRLHFDELEFMGSGNMVRVRKYVRPEFVEKLAALPNYLESVSI